MASEETFSLRAARPGDAEALALVGAASFLESFAGVLPGTDVLAHCRVEHAPEKYAAWVASAGARVCLAELRAAPIGYAVVTAPDLPVEMRASDMEVKRIYLLHRFHGAGVGRALMQWAIRTVRAMGKTRLLLAVYAENATALAFYAKSGFEQVGTREFKVGSGVYHDLVLGMEL